MKTIVVAPHPDDEVLGVGGTLMRRKAEGAELAWLIVTSISAEHGWDAGRVARRSDEIRRVSEFIGFDQVFALDLPSTRLDQVPMADLVAGISAAFTSFAPTEVLVPHPGDVHTDHRAVFTAVASCSKWFRYPSIRRLLAFETPSETDFGVQAGGEFSPNVFVDIGPYLERKIQAMEIYASEIGEFPFPRSRDAIRALAAVRGAASGFTAAEAMMLLRERS